LFFVLFFNLVPNSFCSDVIARFGADSVVIWSAMIMKKRVAVFGDNIVRVLQTVRTLPVMVWHRQSWEQMRPFVTLSKAELEDLKNAGVFVAGFTSDPMSQGALFDVLVNLNDNSVNVMDHAKDDFISTSFHKEMASFLVNTVNQDLGDQGVIKELVSRTKTLLSKLQSLGTDGKVTLQALKDANLPPHMDRFFYQIALAEGFN